MVMTNALRFIACLSVFCLSQASAQEYPTKVITMVVPFAAGGTTDTVARLIGSPVSKNLKELIAYVKANKEKINLANAGLGAASHLCGMLFMSAIQTELTTVPYNGTGPAMNDLLGGQVDLMCDQTTNTTSQIKAGKIK